MTLSPDTLERIGRLVATRMGLHFPRERWGDLEKGLAAAGAEAGIGDAQEYAERLLAADPCEGEIERLACNLTVGETYFFRDKGGFDALERQVLPDLVAARRASGRWLRIWSAGCCTGEEPYSVAMLLDRMIPDLDRWSVTILATDINTRFLARASAGVFGEWSFRAAPPGIGERYFTPGPRGKMQISGRIRRMVSFASLNLASDRYPSLPTNTNAMDIVLCRNVLIYFTREHAARIVASLRESLTDDGWLLVSPSEASVAPFDGFDVITSDLSFIHRKARKAPPPVVRLPDLPLAPAPLRAAAAWDCAPSATPPEAHERPPERDTAPIDVARELANRGRLEEALAWCNEAVKRDNLNPSLRFLRATVARELGQLSEAVTSLEQALYLDADFAMAHFALGTLAQRLGRHRQARRHLHASLDLLARMRPEDPVPEGSGVSAGKLADVIRTFERRGVLQ